MQIPDGPKLKNRLDYWYPRLHAQKKFHGVTFESVLSVLAETVPDSGSTTYLDFGCGPRGGLSVVHGDRVLAFDPYLPKYSKVKPWAACRDVFFSCDVFEHLTVGMATHALKNVRLVGFPVVFVALSTRPATKSFENGLNIHLTIEPMAWWRGFMQASLGLSYVPVLAQDDAVSGQAILAFRRPDDGKYAAHPSET